MDAAVSLIEAAAAQMVSDEMREVLQKTVKINNSGSANLYINDSKNNSHNTMYIKNNKNTSHNNKNNS